MNLNKKNSPFKNKWTHFKGNDVFLEKSRSSKCSAEDPSTTKDIYSKCRSILHIIPMAIDNIDKKNDATKLFWKAEDEHTIYWHVITDM